MGTISRTGITGGGTIQSSHITNIIDALDGTSTTTTVVATGSFSGSLTGIASSATSASYAVTASYATNAVVDVTNAGGLGTESDTLTIWYGDSSTLNVIVNNVDSASFATTASYALNGGSGGGGIFALTGSTYATTNNLEITGSLQVTAGVTASLQGTASFAVSSSRAVTASFADTADSLLVQRSTTDGSFYPVISDSANAQPTAERLKSTTGITINPGTNVIAGATLSGSIGLSGSFTIQDKFATVDLSFIAGDGTGTGQFILPVQQTNASPPSAGSMYWDDANNFLYIYSGTNAAWKRVELT